MTRRRWADPDKRMAAAVRLRETGLSLRQVGQRLGVNEITIRRDLGRWEAQEAATFLATLGFPETANVAGDVAP